MVYTSKKSTVHGSSIEEQTRQFYDSIGWVNDDQGVIGEDKYFRYFGVEHAEYGAKVAAKPAALLKGIGETVLFAGPGDLPASHIHAAAQFDKVICADISERSIEICKTKLGDKGEYHRTSLMELPLEDGSVDATLCTHVIYHIDKQHQRQAVRELIRVTKPGGRVVIVYCNPNAPLMMIQRLLKFLRVNKLLGKQKLYTYYYPLSWWSQFSADNIIEIIPHDAISSNQVKALLPISLLQRAFYNWAMSFEDTNPKLAIKLWSYVTVKINRVT